jgi:membrane protein required for colicin V production
MNLAWPDILIAAILLIAALKGYKRGFIMELAGALALILSLITPWLYNGAFDGALERYTHFGPGSAHVVAMFLVGIATYIAVLIVARALNAIAKLPVVGFGNALAGAAVGLLKGIIGIWAILYIALFFPLSRDIRADLHRSMLVAYITQPNAGIDERISETLPPFARPFAAPVFRRHRV